MVTGHIAAFAPPVTAPGRYSRQLTTAAGARGHSIPRARGADFPPPCSPAAANLSLLFSWVARRPFPGDAPLLRRSD
jgi:hypothetical protein